jgi:hypothetical protein
MTVAELLAHLAKAEGVPCGGRLRVVEGGGLEYVGPRDLLTDTVRAFVREHRAEIVAWLRTPLDALPAEDLALFDCAVHVATRSSP